MFWLHFIGMQAGINKSVQAQLMTEKSARMAFGNRYGTRLLGFIEN